MRGAAGPDNKMVWWLVKESADNRFLLGYDWVLKKWTRCETTVEYLLTVVTPGYTIDDLGSLGYTIDTIPYPVDSVFWAGSGVESLAGFTSGGGFGFFQGTPAAATIETGDLTFVFGNTHLYALGAETDAEYDKITVSVGTKERIGGTTTWHDGEVLDQYSGMVFPGLDARVHRFRFQIAASNWNNFSNILYDVQRAGGYTL
jgi:hypothetical protein